MDVRTREFGGRKAPYAPISALEKFFERIRDRSVPDHVDHHFLQKLSVASNNEYSLLSALKFLGVVDEHGVPTHSYRLLQTTDRFQDTLRHLVETAYEPVFEQGAETWPLEDLVNFFRSTSSASQAKNAARFFLAVSRLAGIAGAEQGERREVELPRQPIRLAQRAVESEEQAGPTGAMGTVVPPQNVGELEEIVLRAKASLLEKLPAPRPDWTAAEYQAICDRFLDLLSQLDRRD